MPFAQSMIRSACSGSAESCIYPARTYAQASVSSCRNTGFSRYSDEAAKSSSSDPYRSAPSCRPLSMPHTDLHLFHTSDLHRQRIIPAPVPFCLGNIKYILDTEVRVFYYLLFRVPIGVQYLVPVIVKDRFLLFKRAGLENFNMLFVRPHIPISLFPAVIGRNQFRVWTLRKDQQLIAVRIFCKTEANFKSASGSWPHRRCRPALPGIPFQGFFCSFHSSLVFFLYARFAIIFLP